MIVRIPKIVLSATAALWALVVFLFSQAFVGPSFVSVSQAFVLGSIVFVSISLMIESLLPNGIEWISIPEFDGLASRMELPSPNVYGVHDKGGTIAYTDPLRKKLIFRRKVLYEKLQENERLALAAHEFAHLKAYHPQVKILMIIAFLSSSAFAATTVPFAGVVLVLLMIVALRVVTRRQEYLADKLAAFFTSPQDMKACIERLTNYQYDKKSATRSGFVRRYLFAHPTPSDRVEKLVAMAGSE